MSIDSLTPAMPRVQHLDLLAIKDYMLRYGFWAEIEIIASPDEENSLYIFEGHHRACAAFLCGEKTIAAVLCNGADLVYGPDHRFVGYAPEELEKQIMEAGKRHVSSGKGTIKDLLEAEGFSKYFPEILGNVGTKKV